MDEKRLIDERIRNEALKSRVTTPEEAAKLVNDGDVVGTSGFTGVGYPKAFPLALAERANKGEKIGITLVTGASTGDDLDGALSRAGVIKRRYPYQSTKDLRDRINSGEIKYVDLHLSQLPLMVKRGIFGKINIAVVEAAAITEEGYIVPTASVGSGNVLAQCADKVVVEIASAIPAAIEGIHDIYSSEKAPNTKPIPITATGDRIGTPYIPCDPDKIAAIIFSDRVDQNVELKPADDEQQKIAEHLIDFLKKEVEAGRLTDPLPPLQSGVGGVANAVLSCLAASDFEDLTVYTEVMQDAVIDLIKAGKVRIACATALTISPSRKKEVFDHISDFKDTLIIRPQEISNSPEVIARLGVIAMNTAIEVDLSGNVNSTHIGGKRMMNGIGGSGDFARNAGLTIFSTASTAKGGKLSCIVPVCSHIDHTEHDVDVVITEQGAADLRGLTAFERAELIIEKCAHPDFKPELRAYLDRVLSKTPVGHGITFDE